MSKNKPKSKKTNVPIEAEGNIFIGVDSIGALTTGTTSGPWGEEAKAATPALEPRRLTYNGGESGPNINGIPARDLEHHELLHLSECWDMPTDAFIEMLCSDTRGRRITAGKPLYSLAEPYICPEENEVFEEWEAFHDHALTHTEKEVESNG